MVNPEKKNTIDLLAYYLIVISVLLKNKWKFFHIVRTLGVMQEILVNMIVSR